MQHNRAALLVVLAALLCGGILAVLYTAGPSIVANARMVFRPKVIVDAGHGGFDGGAVGIRSIVEKDINLAIARNLRDLLQVCGFEVIMTRDEDTALYDSSQEGASIRNRKVSDIHNRLKIIDENPDAIFISIHQNKFEESTSHGAQIFYGPLHASSEALADIMQQQFISMLGTDGHRQYKRGESNIYLLYHAKVPSVLIECGFLSNPSDAEKLVTDSYQKQVAFTIMTGLLHYLQSIRV